MRYFWLVIKTSVKVSKSRQRGEGTRSTYNWQAEAYPEYIKNANKSIRERGPPHQAGKRMLRT